MKRQKKGHRRRFHKNVRLLIVFTLAVLLIALGYAFLGPGRPNPSEGETSDAVIVDQLRSAYPNSTFWLTANSMFHENGWLLHYCAGGPSDTVDFYRTLPQRAFKIIILRVHAALNPETGTLALFTSEKWDDGRASTTYLTDALNERLARVRVTENSTEYFGITANFVKAMDGNFQEAIVIVMGCDGLTNTEMAEAFIEKGAKVYIGWTGPVSADHTDVATQQLLRHLITEKKTIATAITETIGKVGNDPTYGSRISYYPTEAGGYKP